MKQQDGIVRGQWGSRSGFLLAALGAAVGLGNIWRFPYVAGENGGGAFLLIYVLLVVAIGVPMVLTELAIGRAAQREAGTAFSILTPAGPWRRTGLPGVVTSFVILSFYAVIAGWVLKYFFLFALGHSQQSDPSMADYFHQYVAKPVEPLFWHMLVLGLTMAVVMLGVNRGIEKTSKVLMPLLALLLVGLCIHGLFLEEATKGLAFLFVPDWSALAGPKVYLAALGQAFFSISVGLGTLITYGSYLPAKASIAGSALVIALGDTVFAILAGIIVFSAVFTYGVNPGEGPGLAFVTLPEIFSHMHLGILIGSAFFLLLFVAALTSAISLLEIPVAFAIERFGVSRRTAVLTVGTSAFAAGIPSSLGYGVWSDIRPGARPLLDAVDHTASNILLPLSSLLVALFVGWHWSRAKALDSSSIADSRLAQLWLGVVKYIVPLVIGVVFARSLISLAG